MPLKSFYVCLYNFLVSETVAPPEDAEGKSVFETIKNKDKKKRNKNDNAADIEGFLGPWGGYVGEKRYFFIPICNAYY